jgi:hypothetical protein
MVEPASMEQMGFTGPAAYRIIVAGTLAADQSDWLGGMQVRATPRADGTPLTTLVGRMSDQAELNGVVNALCDLRLPILKVELLMAGSTER